MPIGPSSSITDHNRALALFTDRLAERRRFAQYLHADPPNERLIYFHGDGGNGKSLLLKHLHADYCRLLPPDHWRHVNGYPDDRTGNAAFVRAFQALADESLPVPCIYHDFDREKSGEDSPREAWSALLMLRRELGPHRLKLPLFDYAVMRWLYAQGRFSSDELRKKLPVEELDFATALLDLLGSKAMPGVGILTRLIELADKHLGNRLKDQPRLWLAARGLDRTRKAELESLFDPANPDPCAQDQLQEALPRLFAEDLNASMQLPGAPPRLVLMFDTHEAIWGSERDRLSPHACFQRDAWLRRLLVQLFAPNRGIVVVVPGREPPRWPEAADDPIPDGRDGYIDTQLVGHLDRTDANDYLARALAAPECSMPDASQSQSRLLRS